VLATFSFNFNVLLPLVADRTLHQGAQTFGFIAAIFGAGALCGALVNATHGVASLRRLLIGAIGFGVFELVLAPQHSLFVISALLFATGVSYTLWGTNALSVLQLEAPEHLRGRAASMYFFAFQGGAPLGGLFAGWMTTVGGTLLAFSIGGVLSLGTAALGIVRLSTRPA
jgi:MFS family permease